MTDHAPVRSSAEVITDAPARYAKQLVSHLGHTLAVTWTRSTRPQRG